MTFTPQDIAPRAADYERMRKHLHAHPELGFEEAETAALVSRELAALGLVPETGIGLTGVVAVIEGRAGHGNRAVGLRADMDALPITEANGFAHASKLPGKMHGCGHDGHTVMLLAAARLLVGARDRFAGRVVLVFQPGEEGHAGARAMIEDGVLHRFGIDEIYALHNWPALEPGRVALNPARMMAGIDRFSLKLTGTGGHGGHPHQANDPMIPASLLVQALQSIVAKNVSPFDEAVVSLNRLESGDRGALSVVPETVLMEGMTKWYAPEVRELLERRIAEQVDGLARAFGMSHELSHQRLYPPTINTAPEAERLACAAEKVLGPGCVERSIRPSMGSEDFAFFLEKRPGAYFRLGQGRPEAFLHSPHYDFNDAVTGHGAAVLAQVALDALNGEGRA